MPSFRVYGFTKGRSPKGERKKPQGGRNVKVLDVGTRKGSRDLGSLLIRKPLMGRRVTLEKPGKKGQKTKARTRKRRDDQIPCEEGESSPDRSAPARVGREERDLEGAGQNKRRETCKKDQ